MSNTPDTPKPKTVSQMYPDKWLHADDLNGRSIPVTITKSTVESLYDKRAGMQKWRFVLGFGRSKEMVLNKTQSDALWKITSTERYTEWVGFEIMLSPDIAKNGKPTIKISLQPKRGVDKTAVVKAASSIATTGDASEEE